MPNSHRFAFVIQNLETMRLIACMGAIISIKIPDPFFELIGGQINLGPLGSLEGVVAMNSHDGIRSAFGSAVVVSLVWKNLKIFKNQLDVSFFFEASINAGTPGESC